VVFLRDGYVGATMDEIAAVASSSKQTVYRLFLDKETLFKELVLTTVREASDPIHDEVEQLRDSGNMEADLRDLAVRQLTTVMKPEIMALRRLVIGEATRFSELGREFYELGPQRTLDALARSFERLAQRGLLHFETAHMAAEHFNWLIMSTPLNRAMFLGEDTPAPGDLALYAESGVRVFLAAYATEGSPSPK
jgi:AcrR family transcriptional regulator